MIPIERALHRSSTSRRKGHLSYKQSCNKNLQFAPSAAIRRVLLSKIID